MATPQNALTFIDEVLRQIGAPVNATTVQAMTLWLESEQGGAGLPDFANNQGNPLGIQTPEAQASGKAGTLARGAQLTAQLLKASYPGIVNAFKGAENVGQIAEQIVNSPWNTGKADGSGYGGIQSFMRTGGQSAPNGAGTATPTPTQGEGTTTTTVGTQPPTQGSSGVPANTQSSGFVPGQVVQDFGENYTGPNAYKGFDMTSIAQMGSPQIMHEAKTAIDYFTSHPQIQQSMMQNIYSTFHNEAWIASDPEVRTVLIAGIYNNWAANKGLFDSVFQATKFYKTTAPSLRLWQENFANDPAAAKNAIGQAAARVTNIADTLGVQLTPAQLNQIATQAAQLSLDSNGAYVNGLWPDQNIIDAVKADFNPNAALTNLGGLTAQGTQESTGATGSTNASLNGGDAAYLYNEFQTINHDYYLNLTPTDIMGYVNKAIQSDAGQGNFLTDARATFQSVAVNMAKQKYPALGGALGATDASTGTGTTPYASLAWARNMIAQYTGLGSGDNVDLTSPQWSWVLGQGSSPTNRAQGLLSGLQTGNAPSSSSSSTPTIPSADQLQTYLMGTPQFQSTNLAKTMAWNVGSQILRAFGYG